MRQLPFAARKAQETWKAYVVRFRAQREVIYQEWRRQEGTHTAGAAFTQPPANAAGHPLPDVQTRPRRGSRMLEVRVDQDKAGSESLLEGAVPRYATGSLARKYRVLELD